MALETGRALTQDVKQLRSLVGKVLALTPMKGGRWDLTAPDLVEEVWSVLCEFAGNNDPLKDIKADQNRKALELAPYVRKAIEKSDKPFLEAVKFAITGNQLDVMLDTKTGLKKEAAPDAAISNESINNANDLKKRLQETQKVIYFTDNSGEVIFDRILMEQIKAISSAELILVARSLPILNDVTASEARSLGLGDVAKIMENGIREPLAGTKLSKTSKEIQDLVREANVIIAKGVGNLDTMTEEESFRGKTFFLFHGKCRPSCSVQNAPLGSLVVHRF
jgi:uncharacterized protein with ATP-grasp and redox domains